MSKDSLINPDFATSTEYGKVSLTKEELINKLNKFGNKFCRLFLNRGHVCSLDYSFIDSATFSDDCVSELDKKYHGNKTPEQKIQAQEMRKIDQDFINDYYLDDSKEKEPIEVCFASIGDTKCGLYNPVRFKQSYYCSKLCRIFEK